jgi:hypothetical protein
MPYFVEILDNLEPFLEFFFRRVSPVLTDSSDRREENKLTLSSVCFSRKSWLRGSYLIFKLSWYIEVILIKQTH